MAEYPAPISNVDALPKNYDALPRERFWQQYWLEHGTYKFDPYKDGGADTPVCQDASGEDADKSVCATRQLKSRDEIFSIDTPPPTVSGQLHIGHVYSYTQTDMNARYRRMSGKHVFYPFGFDDNGLPTERLVEKERGIRAHEVSREEFIAMCQQTAARYEQDFIALWQSLALSCDWEQYYTTIDERSRAISQASFIDLYNKGYIYRKVAPTQWDWVNQTAIAQAEIEDREVPGHFHYIRFQWADGPGEPVRGDLVIGTTRPELIPACVAVMANPESDQLVRDHEGKPVLDHAGNEVRQRDLIGKIAITPLFEVEVPILPSEKADPEKGTGVLMCCTFGDMDDVEHWQRFGLPTRVIIGKDGRLVSFESNFCPASNYGAEIVRLLEGIHERLAVPAEIPTRNLKNAQEFAEALKWLKLSKARTTVRELLEKQGLLTQATEVSHAVRFAERGDVPVEILPSPQWYVRLVDQKDELINQGRNLAWHPPYMYKRYEQWVFGLNTDWCISRQRYNGVPFPVWYARGQEELRQFLRGFSLIPDSLKEHVLSHIKGKTDPASAAFNLLTELIAEVGFTSLVHKSREKPVKETSEALDLTNEVLSTIEPLVSVGKISTLESVGLAVQDILPARDSFSKTLQADRDWVTLVAPLDLLPVNPLGRIPTEVISIFAEEQSDHFTDEEWSLLLDVFLPSGLFLPDPDVMDTWATSSVTPLLNTHFMPGGEPGSAAVPAASPEEMPAGRRRSQDTGEGAGATNSRETLQRHAQLFPYDMRPQAHDIIRTWAFYTIAKSYFHFGEIPWKDIVISGHAQDVSRQKMSKSKGNVVTPAQMVEKYSADGLRYWSGSVKLGTDTVYDETKLGEGRKLINKLFNATKFALRHLLEFDPGVPTSGRRSARNEDALTGGQHPSILGTITYPTDLWLISRLNACIERATAAHEAFEFGDAKQAIEDFFWADLCDNYLEFSKGRLYGEPLAVDAHPDVSAESLRASAQATLYTAFSSVLRMLAPTLPHITEECWSWYFAQWSDEGSIHLEEWPREIGVPTSGRRIGERDEDALTGGQHPISCDLLLHTVSAVRKWKSERGVSIKTPLSRVTIYSTGYGQTFGNGDLTAVLGDLLSTCNAQRAELAAGPPPEGAVTTERSPVAVVCELAPEAA